MFRTSTLDTLCNLLSIRPLNTSLSGCRYPQNYQIPVTRFRILRLERSFIAQVDFLDQFLERASQDISSFDHETVIRWQPRPIALPKLTSLILRSGHCNEYIADILRANPQIEEQSDSVFLLPIELPRLVPSALR
jgi:hypothetical protein